MSFTEGYADVVIVGGGPVGLLSAYMLQRLGISTIVVERFTKDELPMYGRACTLYPRTLEMLDQVDILDEFLQVGLIGRSNVNFDKDGKRENGRGWQPAFSHCFGTFKDFFLNIRLKYSERLIQDGYERGGSTVAAGWELTDLAIDTAASDGYRVTTLVRSLNTKETKILKSKYVIGADGGSSRVRELSGIPFHPDPTIYRWVRIDGVVKTNMPDHRIGVCSVESPTHGNVLWVPLDHGRTRIGFSLSPDLVAKYGEEISQDDAVREAIASIKPFDLTFEKVDWHTVYSIRQGVAEQYIKDDCVFLAGDACHTHSSGAAQGMNTGVHDAVNLCWKLAGSLRGWYTPAVLQTYEAERRPVALSLIEQDKQIAKAISEEKSWPSDRPAREHPFTALTARLGQFIMGLGISYDENLLNVKVNSSVLVAGDRPFDVLLYPPGANVPVNLQKLTPNVGAFWVLVFTGSVELTRPKLRSFRTLVDHPDSFSKCYHPGTIKFLTLMDGPRNQGVETLGFDSFGRFYYDVRSEAALKYGFTQEEGGIAVLRPDGYLGFATALDKGEEVEDYFKRFLVKATK